MLVRPLRSCCKKNFSSFYWPSIRDGAPCYTPFMLLRVCKWTLQIELGEDFPQRQASHSTWHYPGWSGSILLDVRRLGIHNTYTVGLNDLALSALGALRTVVPIWEQLRLTWPFRVSLDLETDLNQSTDYYFLACLLAKLLTLLFKDEPCELLHRRIFFCFVLMFS